MKKLFTILSLLCLTMVAQAQEVTTWDTAGDLVTFDQFVESAGTGKRYAFRMPSISRRAWCNFTSQAGVDANNLSINDLFTLEVSKEDDGTFWLKRFNDGLFLNGTASSSSWVEEGNAEDGWLPTSLYLENRTPDASAFSDPEEEYPIEETEPYYISFDNIEGLHFNNGNFGFKGGRGGWSAYFAYGPLYVVTVNCVDGEGKKIADPVHHFALDGATFSFNAPEVMGYTSEDPEKTVTVNGEDVAFEFTYSIAQSITYTLNVTGAPEGTKMTIFGLDEVDITATEYISEWGPVTPNQVAVFFPEEFEETLSYKVTVEGNVITVKCFDARYPINFDRDQTYTHTQGGGRKTTWVALGEQKIEWEFGGVGVEPAYRDMTDQPMIVPAGATVTPAIGFEGQWMHGFLYIDLNDDGQFTVDEPDHQTSWSDAPNGELVSYKNQGNVLTSSSRELPDITMPTEPGRYRARFKVDWQSTDPGGNTGADPNDVSSSNHIIANGGCIIDVMLVVGEGHTVTYQVLENGTGTVLAEKTSEVAEGATISAVPSDMLLPDFYDYSEVTPVTVEGDMTITTTATLKENPIFKFTSDTTNPVWYTLTIKKDFHPTYQPDIEPNVALPQEDAGNENTLWAFIGSPYKGFQIINQGAGTGLVLGSEDPTEDDGGTYATLAEPGSQTYELWFPKSSTYTENGFFLFNADGYALNHRSTENLAYWTGGHDLGSTFNAIDPEVAYHNLIDQLKDKPWGTGLNEYTFVYQGEDHTADALDVIASIAPAEYSMENMAALKAALEDAEITLNMPKPNTFLRIKSVKQDSYVSSKTGIEVDPEIASGYADVYTTGAEADDPSTIFFYDGLTLLSYTTGLYSVGVKAAEAGSEGDDMTFEEATNGVGMYWIKPSSTNYWFGGTPTLDRWSSPATNEATRFQLEEVTELPVKLEAGAKGLYYAVFSIPTDASAVSGATVNKVTVKDNKALYSAIEGGIPAETGVLLIGDSENATVTIGQFNGEYVTSDLVPMVKAEIEIEGLFFDPNSTDPFGFYEPTEEMTPRGFTAYLSLDTAGTSPIELADDPDGIELLDAERPTQNGAVYNLQGQKVTKTQKGVYIINNKKVAVK